MNQLLNRWGVKYQYSLILIKELVRTDFKLRYQSSFLGYLWSLLRPLFMFAILYLIFGVVFNAGANIPHYPVYLLLGILLWNYFSEVANSGVTSVVGKGDLLRKLNFPKYVIVLTGTFSAIINLSINFVVLIMFMAVNHVPLMATAAFLPLLLIEMIAFSMATAFLLGALYVKFRDINYIWEIIMQAAFYLTPILYPLSFVLGKSVIAAQLLLLNPMAQIIQDTRYALVTHETLTFEDIYGSGTFRLVPVALTIAFFLFAAWYFRRQSPKFAEEI